MADVKISQLPSATSAASTDLLVIVQGATTKQITNQLLFTDATLVNPALGTPASGNLINCSGYTLNNLTGLGANVATFLATPTSANLATAVSDETGTGALVFSDAPTLNSPILVTPGLGVASATSINKVAITAPATGATLTIVDGKTLTVDHSLTLAGTDGTTMTFPSTSAAIARSDAANTFSGNQTFSGPIITGVQALSGPGAVDVVTTTTAFTSTGTGDALTLANGVLGQIKTIAYVAEAAGADTGILTPATPLGYTTITFTNIGDSVTLQYFTQGWAVIGFRGATVA